jgi:hypothetical protein
MIFISINSHQQTLATSNVGRKFTNFNTLLTKCGVFPHFFPDSLMKSVEKILAKQGSLGQLKQQLKAQQSLAEQVRKLLPTPLNEQLQGAVLSGRRLALLVHSPVWASRVRYLAPQLLRQLRQQGLVVEKVVPRILPEAGKAQTRRHAPARLLSTKNADILSQTADSLEPGPLQEAMRRLSRHHS